MTITLVALALGVVMFLCELGLQRRRWPKISSWVARAAALNLIGFLTVFVCGTGLRGWMTAHRLWSAQRLGNVGGALVGYLVLSFVNYWWHRLRHQSSFFWRWFHQIHHSAQRIEILTTFYKHPIESLVDSVGGVMILYLVVGVTPGAAAGALLLCGVVELFFHWNVSTPYWLGFILQRPESHCLHHQEGVHAYNYADLAIWDILFGTFHNPKRWDAACGLGGENEERILEMLVGVDVTERPARRAGEEDPAMRDG
jgi:sterol desaturase/sphingolipid hydroxylase (fatty acid hydroxylase superfamily)